MKKYLSLIAICVTLTIGLNVNFVFNPTPSYGTAITLSNIEVLANTEDPVPNCYLPGSIDCPSAPVKVAYVVSR